MAQKRIPDPPSISSSSISPVVGKASLANVDPLGSASVATLEVNDALIQEGIDITAGSTDIVVNSAGIYRIAGTIQIDGHEDNAKVGIQVEVNGGDVLFQNRKATLGSGGDDSTTFPFGTVVSLGDGDVISIKFINDSGSSLVVQGSENSHYVDVEMLGAP